MKVEIKHLRKTYGEIQALKDFHLTMDAGIYGLLGANGSGKSTLLNIISKNLKADSGEVLLNPPANILEILGYMPQQQALYRDMSARTFLHYMAKLKKIKNPSEKVEYLLDAVKLADVAHKNMKTFSGGMKQRILLAQALLGDPKILLLDEPTAGLDPVERIRIRNLISSFSKNKVIVIATHVVSDIEYIAKEIILLRKGELLGSRPVQDWLHSIEEKVFEVLTTEEDLANYQENYLVGNIFHSLNGITLRIIGDEKPTQAAKVVSPVLEDVYLYYNNSDLLGTGE